MRVEEEFGLKPCPFCGKEAVLHAETIQRAADCMIPIKILGVDIYETRMYTTVTVGCSDHACLGRAHDPNTISFLDITSAVNAWNTRAERTCRDFYPDSDYHFGCSECGHVRRFIQGWNNVTDSSQDEFNFCPNCGAKVVK